MVVRDFDVVDVAFLPPEADPPLLVDADAVLTFAIPFELLQSVSRRYSEIVQRVNIVKRCYWGMSASAHLRSGSNIDLGRPADLREGPTG